MKFVEAKAKAVAMFSSPDFIKNITEEDQSMVKHLNLLKTINKCGYITRNSQVGNRIIGKKSAIDGKPFEIIERAFITGFMLEVDAIKFIKNLGIFTDKNAFFVPYCSDDVRLPASLDIPLTISKKKNITEVTTHMSTTYPVSYWHLERKEAKINKSEKVVYIFCWDTKWKRNASSATGLFTDVIKILKSLPSSA